jgi:hypothetical protein
MATKTQRAAKSETEKKPEKPVKSKPVSVRNAGKSSGRSASLRTTDHSQIQAWVEKRGGKPATVKGTDKKDNAGLLRIDFPGYSGKDTLEAISWDAFFEKFDESKLEFLYQEKTAGGKESRFNKFVSKE